jgi:4-hydroxy-tetrahydrodipicolinate synthase
MFPGCLTALVTPFRDGSVDTKALADLVESQIAAGVHGLVPCGSTGESATMSHEEHLTGRARGRRVARKRVPGRAPVPDRTPPPRRSSSLAGRRKPAPTPRS